MGVPFIRQRGQTFGAPEDPAQEVELETGADVSALDATMRLVPGFTGITKRGGRVVATFTKDTDVAAAMSSVAGLLDVAEEA